MKKAVLLSITLFALLCLLLTGCVFPVKTSDKNSDTSDTSYTPYSRPEFTPEEQGMISSAASASDISSLLTRRVGQMRYAECEDYDPFLWHFDLLPGKEYYIVESSGEKYVLFVYLFDSYKERLVSISNVEKQYNGDSLSLTVSREMRQLSSGCGIVTPPPVTNCVNCIVRLEKDISSLIVDGENFTEYDGGRVCFKERYGMLDKDLNIVVPIKYNFIYDVTAYDSGNLYYYIGTDEGTGVMDSQYNIVLEPAYDRVRLINDDRYVVLKYGENDDLKSKTQIGIVNGNGDFIHEYIEGWLNDSADFNNKPRQEVFSHCDDNGNWHYGVIDSNLNIVIEPKFDFLREWQVGVHGAFVYYASLENGEQAYFDINGKQITPFEKGDILDYDKKYRDRLTAYIW